MQYKLKLTMPNGEVLETEIVDQLDRGKSVIYFKDSLKDKSTHINFAHTKGERIIPYDLYKSCTLDVIEVDQPIEQPQPTETSNVGKRVEFKIGWEVKEGIIKADPLDLYCILYNGTVYHRIKSDCTILEDQPKSNVGRMVKFDLTSGKETGIVVLENAFQYVIQSDDSLYYVRYADNCELLPE